MEERRKVKLMDKIISGAITGVILTMILIPVNLFALNTNKVFKSPEEIGSIKSELKVIKEDIKEIKIKSDKMEEKYDKDFDKLKEIIIRLDKQVTRIEVLTEETSK